MRSKLALLPLLFYATPSIAQPAPAEANVQIPRELTDPATAEKLANAMQLLSRAFLDLPVGEVQAAMAGRAATPSEKKLTVRDLGERDNPDFERELNRKVAEAKPMLEHGMKALAEAMPAIMQSMSEAGRAIERAATNMPDPTYPKR